MVKFWRMLIAMFAMMAMVVVPTSCGDDDDDDDNKSESSSSLKGKVFVSTTKEEDYSDIEIYSFDEDLVTRCFEDYVPSQPQKGGYSKETDRYEVLSNGLICIDEEFYKYKNGKLYYAKDGEFIETEEWKIGDEDKTGRSLDQIYNEWKAATK